MPPTLLNAGKSTNFVFAVKYLDETHINPINAIDTDSKIKDRMKAINAIGGEFQLRYLENQTFSDNLVMIDSLMPIIVARMLIGYYSDKAIDCAALTDYLIKTDPLSRNAKFYEYKVKQLLNAIALGLKPATPWNGKFEATSGYIIVKTNGEVLVLHIHEPNKFKDYLLNNTKFETGSSMKHGFGVLYQEGDEVRVKLNLQIRFM
jgi:type II restriction enzyme